MIIEQGRVIAANAEWAEVEAGGSGCASCGTASACGVPKEGKAGLHGRMVLRLANTVGAKVGDIVDLSVSSESMTTAVGVAYGMPTVGLIAGMALAHGLFGSSSEALGALLGALSGFVAARLAAARIPSGVRILAIANTAPVQGSALPIYFQAALSKE